MTLSANKTWLAGTALIVLANVIALTGVHTNRSGEPEARLTLTQRELGTSWDWMTERDASRLTLGLHWRVYEASKPNDLSYGYYPGGIPEWLHANHMKTLGFDVGTIPDDGTANRRFERQLPRQVLLVLELAGPAWQAARQQAKRSAEQNEAARRANADSAEFADKAKRANEHWQHEENDYSRLFAVDAGLDQVALRAKYPDRTRYLILKARLRPRLITHEGKRRLTGYIDELAIPQIAVPYAWRPALDPVLQKTGRANPERKIFEATLVVGERLEPWIESVSVPVPVPH